MASPKRTCAPLHWRPLFDRLNQWHPGFADLCAPRISKFPYMHLLRDNAPRLHFGDNSEIQPSRERGSWMTCGCFMNRCYPAYCHLRKTIIMFVFRASFKSRFSKSCCATSGPGIRDEFKEAVFERFYTSRKGEAVIENASGLGLAIVKQIIDAHGGTIEVLSSDTGGAKFLIRL